MKILVITFSISNGGDFLIEKRMNDLIKRTCVKYDIDVMSGMKMIDLNVFNQYDLIIAGGGPYYDDRVIRELFMPLFKEIDNIIPPVHILGSGIYGEDCFAEAIHKKKFAPDVMEFLGRLEQKGGKFGCRDVLSYIVLKNNGIKSVYLTGCPAWYNFDFLEETHVDRRRIHKISKIVISDPGVTKKAEEQEIRAKQAIGVIDQVIASFPGAKIVFTFNNGINTKYSFRCNNIINEYLCANNIPVYELAYDAQKFSVYDDANLHIGFRVHSHIYSLSRRIPSILIEEDLRGYGMNETLGLPHLLSYDQIRMHIEGQYEPNQLLLNELSEIIEYMKLIQFSRYEGVYCVMKNTYYNGYLNWLEEIGI